MSANGPRGLSARLPILLAYASFVLIGVNVGASGVLLPEQIADYGVDKAVIGITFFTSSAGFVIAGAAAGGLIHRFGSRLTLLAGGAAFALSALYLASRPPFVAFVLVQVLCGFGAGALESVLNAHLAGLPNSTTLLNRLHAFFGVGALLGPLVATWVLRFASWTGVLLLIAVAAVPLVIGFVLTYPDRVPAPGSAHPDADGTAHDEQAAGGLLAAALRERGVLLGAALLSVYVGLEIGVGNWAFSYLIEERGHGDVLAGYTVSGYWLGLTLGRFLISPIAVRSGLSAVGMMHACMAGVTVAAALAWLVPGAAAATVGLAMLGFFLGPIFPTTIAVAPDVTAAHLVPTAIGVMNAGSVAGGSALPWLAGAIAQGVGAWTLLPFALALALAQWLVWWRMVAQMRVRAAAQA
jgi:fucose permease